MRNEKQIKEQLQKLEKELLKPSVRKSGQELEKLISDSFIEFGTSGKTYNKQQVISALLSEQRIQISVSRFKVQFLSDMVVLVTYIACKKSGNEKIRSLRSSIWKRTGKQWQIIFHQGTAL